MQNPYRRKGDLSADAAGEGFNLNIPEIVDCGGGGWEQRIAFSGSRQRAAAVGGGARARDSG
jgi:hypothetical protein